MADLVALPLKKLVKNESGKMVFGPKSQCLAVANSGLLPAVLLELPAFEHPYSIQLFSQLSNTVLMPRIDVLNGEKESVRTLGASDAKQRAGSISVEVFFNPENAGERYLLVYADPGSFGEGSERHVMNMNMAYVGTGYWMSGTDTNTRINYVERGKIKVEVKGLPELTK